ncbi:MULTISPECIES: hypothetical protein [Halomonadaceae]|nr:MULTISPECIES: hypothetical protein [Halomonas]MDI4636696.1 hypothetical protein [Halomonas sp. BMC7]NUJ61061.1 hypothetical protein [Halomonas taeanensis]
MPVTIASASFSAGFMFLALAYAQHFTLPYILLIIFYQAVWQGFKSL